MRKRGMVNWGSILFLLLLLIPASADHPLHARQAPVGAVGTDSITVSFQATPMGEVLRAFAEHSGRSIVAGPGIANLPVTAEIRSQPWDVALRVILEANGLVATETESGILRVERRSPAPGAPGIDTMLDGTGDPGSEPTTSVTRVIRIEFARADEIARAVAPHLTPSWGRVSVMESANAIVVTDRPEVVENLERLIR